MCRTARFVLAITALMLSVATTLAAQGGASARIRAQERLVDSMVSNLRRASAALGAFDDSVSRASVTLDSVRIGNLQVLVEPAVRERTERAMRIASPRLDSLAGAAAHRLQAHWLVIRAARGDTLRDTVVVALRVRTLQNQYRDVTAIWGKADDTTLATWVYDEGVTALSMTHLGEMQVWLRGLLRPDTMTTTEWLATRLEMCRQEPPFRRVATTAKSTNARRHCVSPTSLTT